MDRALLSQQIGKALLLAKATLSTAESCTGGWVASTVIDTAGSSQWFERGFVTYTNQAKMDVLNVSSQTLADYGAVSEQTAAEMVLGVLRSVASSDNYANRATQWAVSTTGVAGPGGGTASKPVGMVCFGFAQQVPGKEARVIKTSTEYFQGDRTHIREQAVCYVLQTLQQFLENAK